MAPQGEASSQQTGSCSGVHVMREATRDLANEPMYPMRDAGLGQEHKRALARDHGDAPFDAELDRCRTTCSLSATAVHPDAPHSSLSAVPNRRFAVFRRG